MTLVISDISDIPAGDGKIAKLFYSVQYILYSLYGPILSVPTSGTDTIEG
jgi:hypothetical protein